MNTKRWFYGFLVLLGIGLLLVGVLVFNSSETKMASGLSFGIGAATSGLGIGWLIRSFVVTSIEDEAIRKSKEIEINDERNTRIRERTGYMVARIMNYVLCVFILILGFMGADRNIILMVAGLILLEGLLTIYFSSRYSKTM
ncbi:hypothetical protein [Leptolinea tardivitalis]|uniref:DUF2178 domain-containing protein n=1 Tax=Leptolinea tardivitalis TaxID=229920 RepID=A0A0P6WV12_9CHLR|nr:hypothetical protein [Leptolinea tardivitalis]KPL70431.1 hypothetical protein ADM99_14920 [Leptolinea tardivitalis]GAP22014.1 hypothetical protein LTAR_02232 [Leptolinea tardivitalis]